jgi:hypothetical protein
MPDEYERATGDVLLGLGPPAKLPPDGTGPGHTRASVRRGPGAGVEVGLELAHGGYWLDG